LKYRHRRQIAPKKQKKILERNGWRVIDLFPEDYDFGNLYDKIEALNLPSNEVMA